MKKYLFPTLTIACLMIGFLIGNAVSNKVNAQRFYIQNGQLFSQPESKIDQLLQLMNEAYVEPINVDSITDEVMMELVERLDPHSAYIPKEDLEMVNSELSASFSGIGVQFSIQNDTIQVVSVISGGPSEGIGVLAGDKIVSVNDSAFTGKTVTNERVMHALRGPKDTQVTIGVVRSGTPEVLSFTITRGEIPVHSVDAKFIIDGELICDGGEIYTTNATSQATNHANITSNGGGKVTFGSLSGYDSQVYQIYQEGTSPNWKSVSVAPARLRHGNGTYETNPQTGTYTYVNNKWTLNASTTPNPTIPTEVETLISVTAMKYITQISPPRTLFACLSEEGLQTSEN